MTKACCRLPKWLNREVNIIECETNRSVSFGSSNRSYFVKGDSRRGECSENSTFKLVTCFNGETPEDPGKVGGSLPLSNPGRFIDRNFMSCYIRKFIIAVDIRCLSNRVTRFARQFLATYFRLYFLLLPWRVPGVSSKRKYVKNWFNEVVFIPVRFSLRFWRQRWYKKCSLHAWNAI